MKPDRLNSEQRARQAVTMAAQLMNLDIHENEEHGGVQVVNLRSDYYWPTTETNSFRRYFDQTQRTCASYRGALRVIAKLKPVPNGQSRTTHLRFNV